MNNQFEEKYSMSEILKRHIYARGKKQTDIADYLGLTSSHMSYRLKNNSFTVEEFISIISYLGLDFNEIVRIWNSGKTIYGIKLNRLNEIMHKKAEKNVINFLSREDVKHEKFSEVKKMLKEEYNSLAYVVDALVPLSNEYDIFMECSNDNSNLKCRVFHYGCNDNKDDDIIELLCGTEDDDIIKNVRNNIKYYENN